MLWGFKPGGFVKKLRLFVALGAVAVTGLAGCGRNSGPGATTSTTTPTSGSESTASGPVTITAKNFAFEPSTVNEKAGVPFTFKNADVTVHSLTADDKKSFDTGNVNAGDSAVLDISTPGTYKYHCTIHPTMTGTIKVS
jgi:plastocyanin